MRGSGPAGWKNSDQQACKELPAERGPEETARQHRLPDPRGFQGFRRDKLVRLLLSWK